MFDLLGKEPLDAKAVEPLLMFTNDWIQRQPNGRIQDAIERLLATTRAPTDAPADPSPAS